MMTSEGMGWKEGEHKRAPHIVIYPLIFCNGVCHFVIFFASFWSLFSFLFSLHFPTLHSNTTARERPSQRACERERKRETSLLACTHHAMENASVFSPSTPIPILCLVCPTFISTCSCIVLESHSFSPNTQSKHIHKGGIYIEPYTNGAQTQRVM